MLHDFIVANTPQIVERARRRASERLPPRAPESGSDVLPLFLGQLVEALSPSLGGLHLVGGHAKGAIIESAALHGRALSRQGFDVSQVVHGFGDICQVLTDLASEAQTPVTARELRVFAQCMESAIAGAVTAHTRQREADRASENSERIGVLAHELDNLLNLATLSFQVLKKSMVGRGVKARAVHARSLSALRTLVERSLDESRLGVGHTPRVERIVIGEFIEELSIGAAMQAEGRGLELSVQSLDRAVTVEADRHLLASALWNLLQNAFKFTRANSKVSLSAHATQDRVLIDVGDQCGGLPPGKVAELNRVSAPDANERSRVGLGLSIARSAIRANLGELHVRDVPGKGCVFSIDLPRRYRPPTPLFQLPQVTANG
jgi:signal transduction histidine kinase